jgi:hypothetical protein
MTDPLFIDKTANESEVSIKTMAATVVSLFIKVAAPLLPKSVWVEPPNAAPISAPLLLWIKIMKIKNKHTIR